jgi:hypothetical protein
VALLEHCSPASAVHVSGERDETGTFDDISHTELACAHGPSVPYIRSVVVRTR